MAGNQAGGHYPGCRGLGPDERPPPTLPSFANGEPRCKAWHSQPALLQGQEQGTLGVVVLTTQVQRKLERGKEAGGGKGVVAAVAQEKE